MTRRDDVVSAAAAELGEATTEKLARFWASDGLGKHPDRRLAWCGIFALYCLHKAGLGLDKPWKIGAGFILQQPHPLKLTTSPLPGDIGYQNAPWQHHFVVESVGGNMVHSIDGNQPDIRRKTRALGPALTFYSIEPLLIASLLPSPTTLPPAPPLSVSDTQRAINNVILRNPLGAPSLLKVDGIFGPKTSAAIVWARAQGWST